MFPIDENLYYKLCGLAHDSKRDFSFVIAISGDGMVRVGKSVFGQQCAYVLAEEADIGFDYEGAEQIIFSGEDLIGEATKYGLKGERKVFIFDEARASMNSKQAMSRMSKVLGDFFAETGKFNHILILILPDFFELEKRYALNYADFLINVRLRLRKVPYKNNPNMIVETRERGFFNFYSRSKKKLLYIYGKEQLNYQAIAPRFSGKFTNTWCVDKEAYEKKKDSFLSRDRSGKKVNVKTLQAEFFDKKIMTCYDKFGKKKTVDILNEYFGIPKNSAYMKLKSLIEPKSESNSFNLINQDQEGSDAV